MYCTRRNHSMQTLSFLPLLDLNHVFAYQKQSEATSATEISVSRCLLWKYVMSNKNLSHDSGAAHCACSSIQNLRNEKLFLQYPCQGQFQESGAFYQQMVCWQLCCDISSTLWYVTIFYFVCPVSKKCNAITLVWFRSVLYLLCKNILK